MTQIVSECKNIGLESDDQLKRTVGGTSPAEESRKGVLGVFGYM